MNGLKTSVILLSMIFLLPGVYGLNLKMGASNGVAGGSENLYLNAGLDSSVASSTSFCPDNYDNIMKSEGNGEFNFYQTFKSMGGDEYVRLTANMSDSSNYVHTHKIEKLADKQIKVSQSLMVDKGECIEASAEAWNSLGLSAKVGLKIPAGSVVYESYGEATDENAIANQEVEIPECTRFSVFAEATREISSKDSSASMKPSPKPLTATTTATATQKKTKVSTAISRDKPNKNSILK